MTRLQPYNVLAWSYTALCYAMEGDQTNAQLLWKEHGISDNRELRLRIILWMEGEWLVNRSFFYPREFTISGESGSRRRGFKHFYKQRFERALTEFASCRKRTTEIDFATAYCAELVHDYNLAFSCLERLPENDTQWPDDMIALKARCLIRTGRMLEAADLLNRVTILGPYDYGANYYLGLLCLAAENAEVAERQFKYALNHHYIDTLEFQWWQIERALMCTDWKIQAASPS